MNIRMDKIQASPPHGLRKHDAVIVFKTLPIALVKKVSEVRFANTITVSKEKHGWQDNLFLADGRLTMNSRGLSRTTTIRHIVCFLVRWSDFGRVDQRSLSFFLLPKVTRDEIAEIESVASPIISEIKEKLPVEWKWDKDECRYRVPAGVS